MACWRLQYSFSSSVSTLIKRPARIALNRHRQYDYQPRSVAADVIRNQDLFHLLQHNIRGFVYAYNSFDLSPMQKLGRQLDGKIFYTDPHISNCFDGIILSRLYIFT